MGRGRGKNGNQRGRGRSFINFGPNFGFNNGQSSGNPNFGFNSGQSSGTANTTPQFPSFQSHSQFKNGGTSSSFHLVLVFIRFKVNLRILDLPIKFVAKMDTLP